MPDPVTTWLIQGLDPAYHSVLHQKTKLHELGLSDYDLVKTRIMELTRPSAAIDHSIQNTELRSNEQKRVP